MKKVISIITTLVILIVPLFLRKKIISGIKNMLKPNYARTHLPDQVISRTRRLTKRHTQFTCGNLYERGRKCINNEKYYEYLIDSYQNLVFSVCFKITGDYFEAEDLAQETFISAYKHLDTFDRQHEKAWLCKIATNKCLDYLKKSERRNVPTEDDYFLTQVNNEPGPEENVLELEAKKQLSDRCKRLKSPYREVALDYFYNEISAAEIAAKTGKNIKTVQTQIYRARSLLQKSYKKGDVING